MNFDAASITMYINIGIGVLLFIAFIIGYVRGLFKSTFYVASAVGVVLLFLIFSPVIVKTIMTTDVSSYNIDFNGTKITTLSDLLKDLLVTNLNITSKEGLLLEETMVYKTAYSLFEVVIRLVLLLVVILLNMTVFRWITWIIYFIVKPRKKDENGKRIKIKKMNRLYGGLVGVVHFFLILLIFCVPLGAVFSVAEKAEEIILKDNGASDISSKIILTFEDSSIKLSSSNKGLIDLLGLDDETVEIFEEYVGVYRDTIPGAVYSVKLGGASVDALIFDALTEIDNGQNTLAIRKEMVTALEVVEVIADNVDLSQIAEGEDAIFNIIDNLNEENINLIFDKLSELDVVQFAVPLAIDTLDVMVNHGELATEIDVNLVDVVKVLKDTDYKEMVQQVGSAVAAVKTVLDEAEISSKDLLTMNFEVEKLLSVDSEVLDNLFENIGGLEIIDTLYDSVIDSYEADIKESLSVFILALPKLEISEDGFYIINGKVTNVRQIGNGIDGVSATVDASNKWILVVDGNEYVTGLDASSSIYDISLKDIKLAEEIKNLGNIWEKLTNLGIDPQQLSEAIKTGESIDIDFEAISEESIKEFADALLASKIFSKASRNIVVFVNNILPNEYRNLLVVPNEVTPEELTSILMLGKVVISSGILEDISGENGEIDINKLFNENKDLVVDTLKKSNIFMSNATPILSLVLDTYLGEDIIIIPDNINWGDEIGYLFDAVDELLAADLFAEHPDFSNVDVEALSLALSKSKVITSSMNNVISYILENTDIEDVELDIPTDIVWDYQEIHSTVSAALIVLDTFADGEDDELVNRLIALEESQIDDILSSDLIADVIVDILYALTKEGAELDGVVEINIDKEDKETWFGKESNKGELKNLFLALRYLLDGVDINDEDNLINNVITNVVNIKNEFGSEEDEVCKITDSIILTDTLVMYMEKMASEEQAIVCVPDGVVWTDTNEPGEIRKMLKALQVLFIDEEGNIIVDFESIDTEAVLDLTDNDIDTIVDSVVLKATVVNVLNDVLYGGVLDSYVQLSDDEAVRKEEISSDLGNLIKVLRDLNELGVEYESFSFATFKAVINESDNKNAKADEIAEALAQSDIIVKSLNKMMKSILSSILSEDEMKNIKADLSEEQWRGNGNDEGELKRLLRLIVNIEDYINDADNSNISNPETLSKPLKEINNSLVLHGLVSKFISTATDDLDSWRSGKEPQTVAEWDKEIETLAELVAKVYSMNIGLGGINVSGASAINPNDLGTVLKLVNKSVILDIKNIVKPLETGVEEIFNVDVTAGNVDDGQEAWDKEIDIIVAAVKALQNVDEVDIKDATSARNVGKFLDSCSNSKLLKPVINSVVVSVLGEYSSYVDINLYIAMYGTYESAFVNMSSYLNSIPTR